MLIVAVIAVAGLALWYFAHWLGEESKLAERILWAWMAGVAINAIMWITVNTPKGVFAATLMSALLGGLAAFEIYAAKTHMNRPNEVWHDDDASDPDDRTRYSIIYGPRALLVGKLRKGIRNWPVQAPAITLGLWAAYNLPYSMPLIPAALISVMIWAAVSYGLHSNPDVWAFAARNGDRVKETEQALSKARNEYVKQAQVVDATEPGRATIVIDDYVPTAQRRAVIEETVGNMPDAVAHKVTTSADKTRTIIETYPEYGSDAEKIVAETYERQDNVHDVQAETSGHDWITVTARLPRLIAERQQTADSILNDFDGYVCREPQPEQIEGGDRFLLKLWKKYPTLAHRTLFLNIWPKNPMNHIEIVADPNYQIAYAMPCEQTEEARFALAEQFRALIPDAQERIFEPDLQNPDITVFQFFPAITQTGPSETWDKLTEKAKWRKPADPPVNAEIYRDDKDRVEQVVFKKGPTDTDTTLDKKAAQLANVLDANEYELDYLGDNRIMMQFVYTTQPEFLLTHPQDLPEGRSPQSDDNNYQLIRNEWLEKTHEIFVGVTAAHRPIFFDLTQIPHILICGAPGSGKGMLLTSTIAQLLMAGHKVEIMSIKVSEFSWAKTMGAKVLDVDGRSEQLHARLESYLTENKRRKKIMDSVTGVRNWGECLTKAKKMAAQNKPELLERMRQGMGAGRVAIVMDELASTFETIEAGDIVLDREEKLFKRVYADLLTLVLAGRSAWINIILITQSPLAKAMGGDTKLREAIQGRVWVGKPQGTQAAITMDRDGRKVEAMSAHGIGQAGFVGSGSTPKQQSSVVLGRTPHISMTQAPLIVGQRVGKHNPNHPLVQGAIDYLEDLDSTGEIPDWMRDGYNQLKALKQPEPEPAETKPAAYYGRDDYQPKQSVTGPSHHYVDPFEDDEDEDG